MKTYRVQLLVACAGAYRGSPGDILTAPGDKAQSLARAGMAVICGDQPGETIDPGDVDATPTVPVAPSPAPAEDEPDELATGPQPGAPDVPAAPPPATAPSSTACPPTAAALRLAQAHGVDIALVAPGKDGVVRRKQVQQYLDAQATPAAAE